jgi:hypothetical protein
MLDRLGMRAGSVEGFRGRTTKTSKTTPCKVAGDCRRAAWRTLRNHLTRRANQRHDATVAARVIGGVLANPSEPAQSSLTRWWEGKKMRQFGKVDIPQEAFIAALKVDS